MKKRAILPLALTAALASGAQAQRPMQLEFWGGWTGPDADVMRDIVAKWNKEHPNVQVKLTTQQWTPLFQKFVLQARAGNPPDLLALNAPAIPQWADLGTLTPLDDLIAKAKIKSGDFAAVVWKGSFYQGKQYGIPLDQHMHGLFINADLFRKAGLDPSKPPRTGKALVDAAIKLTVDANGKHPNEKGFDASKVRQWGLSIPTNHHGFYMWYALMAQQGETLLNSAGNQTGYDAGKSQKAWQFLNDLVFKHKVVPVGSARPADDFRAGRTAMLIDGAWQLPALEGQEGLKFVTAPFPQVFSKPAVWGAGHTLTIPAQKDKARQQAAFEVAAWIVKNSELWAKAGHIPALKTAAIKAKSLPGRSAFVNQLQAEVMVPPILKSAEVFSADATSPIVVASQAALVANKPLGDVDKAMRTALDRLLSQP
ncbi:multiple sugar transport system substrate-binding protein [Deinobacterium chartae]|uniref:Multiple sugar transport system substrate-binding protein n=1 Tax=Deinobacterium chartae TaxID=521158 RepID=A0A841HTU4_9DEIO|nr:ABC transporter substrate-binding protein [Deinobacterium chartae]MBB6096777.1 multiple sugar transport system substrate-binding protein [Deinobacterium chartae]